jgi:hypothetical protein
MQLGLVGIARSYSTCLWTRETGRTSISQLYQMSDRGQLEKAEARMLVPSYFATVALLGRPKANVWLTKQIAMIEKHYGKGFDARCRGYMREIVETELCVEQQG